MRTPLYGCIVEDGFYGELQHKIKLHNDAALKSLPEFDEWPPLTRQMFAITQDSDYAREAPTYEYKGRVFHFGGQFKSIEYDWKAWKAKFENLLTKLVWQEAYVHFEPEFSTLQTFKWRMIRDKWNPQDKIVFEIKPEYWEVV